MQESLILKKLEHVIKMNNEFLDKLEKEKLKLTIPEVSSNTIGSQFHCIIGARNSYFKSIIEDRAFSWEPELGYDKRYDFDVITSLMVHKSKSQIEELKNIEKFSDNQLALIIDLISHEFMHQGQLIRFLYANQINMPKMTKKLWHLEDL